jgi:hypothetical protein
LTVETVSSVLNAAEESIQKAVETVAKLSSSASKLPYYKFNHMWSRQVQDIVSFPVHIHSWTYYSQYYRSSASSSGAG